jgi:hypothetical protein
MMLLIGALLLVVIATTSLIGNDNSEKVMRDFCKVECKQNIKGKYKFCC